MNRINLIRYGLIMICLLGLLLTFTACEKENSTVIEEEIESFRVFDTYEEAKLFAEQHNIPIGEPTPIDEDYEVPTSRSGNPFDEELWITPSFTPSNVTNDLFIGPSGYTIPPRFNSTAVRMMPIEEGTTWHMDFYPNTTMYEYCFVHQYPTRHNIVETKWVACGNNSMNIDVDYTSNPRLTITDAGW